MARAAGALAAPVLHAGEMQFIPQEAQQLLIFFRCDRLAVDKKRSHFLFSPFILFASYSIVSLNTLFVYSFFKII